MIDRFYLKDFLSFKEVDLEFKNGLIVFTGPSGAGKSVLMDAFLSLFGYKDARAVLGEVTISDASISNEAFDITPNDNIIIKEIKKEKVRYFVNNQTISKKNLHEFSQNIVKHLHLKDVSDFQSNKLISFLDKLSALKSKKFLKIKNEYETTFIQYSQIKEKLQKIREDELKIEDLKEYAKFEIEKITSLDPKVDEYEELNRIKKQLSRKDKIEDAIKNASVIFESSSSVSTALELMERDSGFFDESINELNNIFESFNDSLSELEELDIENVLDRIEKLSSLQKRFGSIEAALEYKDEKQKELSSYENITFEKSLLEKQEVELKISIEELAKQLTQHRTNATEVLKEKINYYLKFLYLSNATILLEDKNLDITGANTVLFELNGVNLDTISSGEFNRLRLALLTSMSEYEIVNGGILFLDEIDANLSGKESNAIANVLATLSKTYQIFAISHQPQLTASAAQHFLVDKKDGISSVKVLNKDEKIEEISRMISGEDITKEAREFATNLVS
jgi:DNA repair protein RecN (Recombination protein N)